MVVLFWVGFQYSVAIPLVTIQVFIALLIMYWVDKYLMLRFYRYPKNWNIAPINFVMSMLRLTVLFHFVWGSLFLSNNDILVNDKRYL